MTWLIFLIIVFFLVIMHLSSHVNECRRILYRLKPNHDKSLWTRIDFPSLLCPHVWYFQINSNHFYSLINFHFNFDLCKVSFPPKDYMTLNCHFLPSQITHEIEMKRWKIFDKNCTYLSSQRWIKALEMVIISDVRNFFEWDEMWGLELLESTVIEIHASFCTYSVL